MARFIITLYLSSNRQCAVTREVTRRDDERAILFAQELLHKSRLSTRILWQWYDAYSVEEVTKDGETREVGAGTAAERDCYRAGYKPESGRKAGASNSPAAGASRIVGAAKGKPADTRADYLPIRKIGQAKRARAVKELSPYQQKLRAVVEAAQERKLNSGHVSRMGSNTHD